MTHQDKQRRYRRQIEQLLNYPRVGPLTAHGIATNMGVPQEKIQATLDSLVAEGHIVRASDGRFAGRAGTSAGAADGDAGTRRRAGHDDN